MSRRRAGRALLGCAVVLMGCGATVGLDHIDGGGGSSGPSGTASSGGTSGSSGSSGASGGTSSGGSGSTSGGTSSGSIDDAGVEDVESHPITCTDPLQNTVVDSDAGTCFGTYEIQCGVVPYSATCKCPEAKCACQRFGIVKSIPYTGCAGCTGLSAAYDSCGFPRK